MFSKAGVTMGKNDINRTIKKAIKMAFAIEKVIRISNEINDLSDGIEEIERSLGKSKRCNNFRQYPFIRKK